MRRFLLLCGLATLVGCSSNSFLGRRADNFTAYYNTYYNARASFEAGVRSLEQRTEAPVDRTRYLSLFPEPPRGGNQEFEKAIVKSADVLREHPDSRWADDALLLIGKSYFYTGQFVGAEQKFREIIYTLAEQRGEASPLENEARFWLARTLVTNEAYDRAEPFLEETLVREGIPRRWQGQYLLVQGELFVRQGRWDEAAEALRAGIDGARDRDLRARAYLLLGQVEETRERYDDAIAAFRRVERFNPSYDLRYAAQLSAVRIEGQHGDTRAALEELRRMERDGKNYEFRNEIRYVRGLILQATDRPGEALSVYDDVLYGLDGDVSAIRGRLHYALGQLYRDVYEDYFLAAAHFDTAATALGPVQPTAQKEFRTAEAILDATDLKTTFGTFASAMREVQQADSLLTLGALPPEAFAARIHAIREQRARELEAEQRELERRSAQRAFGGEAGREGAATGVQAGGSAATAGNAAQSGFLSYRDPVRVRENRQAFIDLWGDRPLVDNWRRSAAITGTERVDLEASLDPDQDSGQLGEDNEIEQLPQVDLSAIPRTEEAQAQMRTRRAEARYRLGNVLFLNMNRPDSAAAWYRHVIEEDREEVVAPRAYYALAELQRALGDSLAAEQLYRETLQAYPESDFAGRIRERLGLAEPAALDSAYRAAEAYERARTRWQRGALAPAFDSLLAIPARFPSTPTAPKALYAAGTLFLEWSTRDSLDVLTTPLPTSVARLAAIGLLTPVDTLPPLAPAIPADTAAAVRPVTADTAEVAATPPAEPQGPPARYAVDLFRLVQRAYPGTPYAEEAARRADVLEALAAERAAAAPVDSLAVPADTTGTPPAVVEAEAEANARVTRLRRETDDVPVGQHAPPETPQPRRTEAQEMDEAPAVQHLPETEAGPPLSPDTSVSLIPEPDSTDTRASPAPEPSDSLATSLPQAAIPPPAATAQPQPDDPLRGSAPVVAGSGYTIVAGGAASEAEAERLSASYRARGYRVGVLAGHADGGGEIYRVCVGHFATMAEAERGLVTLRGILPSDAWIFNLR